MTQKAKFRKAISIFVTVLMVVALMPSMVFADTTYQEWSKADSLPTSGVYKLTTSVTLSDKVTVGGWASERPEQPTKTLVLDLNGHTITASSKGAFYVQTSGGLTIEDSSAEGTGKIVSNGSNEIIYVGGAFSMTGGTIQNDTSSYALFVNGSGKADVSGGSIINAAKNGYAVQVNSNASMNFSNGTIQNTVNGGQAVYVNTSAKFTMTGGKVMQDSTYSSSAAIYSNGQKDSSVTIAGGEVISKSIGIYSAFSPVTVTGGSINADNYAFQTRYATVDPAEGKEVAVTSGKSIFYTFGSSDNKVLGGAFDAPAIVKEYTTSDDNKKATISGGSFTTSPADYVDADSTAVGYTKPGEDKVFLVGSSKEIAEEVNSAVAGSTIDILKGDVDLSIAVDGVTISNSGDGNVTVNGDKVNQGDNIVIEHPTVSVTKPDVFTVGEAQEYTVSTTGGSKTGTMVKGYFKADNANIAKIEYYETADGNWYELTGDSFGPQSGFPLGDFTSKFRVTFTEAGCVNATIQIKAVDNDAVLAETTAEFKGVPAPHVHTPTEVKAKAATCTEDGNIAYWYCADCGKYFSDAALTNEIPKEATVVKATGHHAVKVEATEPTATDSGNIAYWYCADCGKYFSDEALTKEISKDSIMIPATGEKPDKNETTDVPKTGDTGMLPWMLALLLSAGGFTVLGIKKKHAK
ncbi:hypothetical protein H8702_04940 [Massilimaliae timonensis]|uniref:Gram-positive cocci surface proteins LPxTG domain-containing protein n=1 Tax=Massiliimalia timonensis TaxID=1987501 RepID=A0A8J6TYU5_9FIRM|nr:hypothetical protein [Massiliimalia timonensis]MBC8610467.1 hypothetical protein [Massiliimalia timonensis]